MKATWTRRSGEAIVRVLLLTPCSGSFDHCRELRGSFPTKKMLLTKCAACATELGFSGGKKCGRCSTRYCGPTCQTQHWKECGHDKLCKKTKKGCGAEQDCADKKYKEAVAVAVEKCADDTKGQKCYLCLEAVHPRTGEGLVRGCACGDRDGVSSPELGVVHVSCLARQAQILREEAEENNLGIEVRSERWVRWSTCSLCEQRYHGVVNCALGWACWRTYLGRPEGDAALGMAMEALGNDLNDANRYEDTLSVDKARLSLLRRIGASEDRLLAVQSNLASTHRLLGRSEQALRIMRDVYPGRLRLHGKEHPKLVSAANNYGWTLATSGRCDEAKPLLRKMIPVAQRVLGNNDRLTLTMRSNYAQALCADDGATLDDLRKAVTTLEDTARIARRVFGISHPAVSNIECTLQESQASSAPAKRRRRRGARKII